MNVTNKITISMTAWVSMCLVLVGSQEVELFGILVLIGLLISRELSSAYTKPSVGEKLDVMIYVGIIFFIVVVARRILSILGIF